MNELSKPNLFLALVHYPVINKEGNIIASAVTNLDLHDIARAGKTFGVQRYYVITPLEDQVALVNKIVAHWTTGGGAAYNGLRKKALDLIRVQASLADAVADIERTGWGSCKTIMTCAKSGGGRTGFKEIRSAIKSGDPHLLVFGTAWGLAESLLTSADYILEPIAGNTAYNHLPVRSAAAIVLDRLLSDWEA